MTYLSMLDDSQAELLGGGFASGDRTFILGISYTSLSQRYDISQRNNVENNVQAPGTGSGWGWSRGGGSGGGSPLYAASVYNALQNIAIVG
jgi:hypothetical protein